MMVSDQINAKENPLISMEIEKEEETFIEPANALSLGVMLIVPCIAYASILIMQGNWTPLRFQKQERPQTILPISTFIVHIYIFQRKKIEPSVFTVPTKGNFTTTTSMHATFCFRYTREFLLHLN